MAQRLAEIAFTEKDGVNCPFYFKIGACRHGDTCTRNHVKPYLSQTVLIPHMYENSPAAMALSEGTKVPEETLKEIVRHFEDFYEEVFMEFAKFGELEDLNICDNIGDHLIGNVYAMFVDEEAAERALKALNGRYYAGRLITCEYSPVTDFRDARCRQYDTGCCTRGGYCNFMHLKHVSSSFKKSLFRDMYEEHPEYKERRRGGGDRGRGGRDRDRRSRRSHSRSNDHKSRKSRSRSKEHKHRHKSHRSHRSRSRSHDKDRKSRRSKHSSDDHRRDNKSETTTGTDIPLRQTSEERRAMIAQWNVDWEEKAKTDVSNPPETKAPIVD